MKNALDKVNFRMVWPATIGLFFFLALATGSCREVEVLDQTVRAEEGEVVEEVEEREAEPVEFIEEKPPISEDFLGVLRPCDGFDYPVGPPNAKDYYKFRGFLPKDLEHLGEDWNGTGGGNTDFGDYVYAAADGVVFYSDDYRAGWGNVIRMIHNYGTEREPRYVESLYAHVASSWVRPGNRMRRGQVIGTIGDAKGKYHAHLHFEMRRKPGKDIGCGYDGDTLGFVDPTRFIEAHRPGN